MGYMGTGFGCGTCSTACVGKKIQNLHRAIGFLNDRREPVPVGSLFREQTGVLEAEWLQVERKAKVMVLNRPLLRQVKKLPFAAAFVVAVVMAVHLLPAFIRFWCIPDDLWVRAYKNVLSPAFEFFAAAGIDDFIIFPIISSPHNILHNI